MAPPARYQITILSDMIGKFSCSFASKVMMNLEDLIFGELSRTARNGFAGRVLTVSATEQVTKGQ